MVKVTSILLAIISIALLFTYSEYKNENDKRVKAENDLSKYIANFKHIEDSVKALVPDTIKLPADTIKGYIEYVDRWHDSMPANVQTYADSLINDSIDVRIYIKADRFYGVKYAFKPTFIEKEVIINNPVPYPVIQKQEVEIPQTGLYGGIGLGYGDGALFSVQAIYLTKKQTGIGAEVLQYQGSTAFKGSFLIRF